MHTSTSIYQNPINFFVKPLQKQESPSKKCANAYTYGFNGQEKENALYGEGKAYDFGARMYDSRTGRMFSPDPREANYPWQSTYAYYANSPMTIVDINGEGGGDAVRLEYRDWMQDYDKAGVLAPALINPVYITIAAAWNNTVVFGLDAVGYLYDNIVGKANVVQDVSNAASSAYNYMSTTPQGVMAVDALKFATSPEAYGMVIGAAQFGAFRGEKPSSLANTKPALTITNDMSLVQKVSTRKAFVKKYWNSAIEAYTENHIDWKKPVQNVTHSGTGSNGQRLVQWRNPNNPNASPFFTYEGVDPATLGIPKTHTQMYYVELPGEQTFLQSTANTVKAYAEELDPGINGQYIGGGTQLYSPEAQKIAKFTPAGQ